MNSIELKRPYVVCHMMQTLDGKIASGVADKEILMDFFDTYTATEHELDGKTWMFGRKTAEAFSETTGSELIADVAPSETLPDGRDFIAQSPGTFVVTIDVSGVLRWKNSYISLSNQEEQFHLITIFTQKTPQKYLAYLEQKGISYIYCGEQEVDFALALSKLRENFKIEKILLEGGGSLNGSMMAADLVDEISLLLIPRVLNKKDAPALFDRDTQTVEPKNYELSSVKQLDNDVMWLRYSRKKVINTTTVEETKL